MSCPTRFFLKRNIDETGVSGTGRVLEGVVFQSGTTVIEWRPPRSTVSIFRSFEEFKEIHVDSHPHCSEVVWIKDIVV